MVGLQGENYTDCSEPQVLGEPQVLRVLDSDGICLESFQARPKTLKYLRSGERIPSLGYGVALPGLGQQAPPAKNAPDIW